MRQVFSHTPASAERSSVLSTNPYRVIEPIRVLRKELGLTPNDLVTLQALISFMPKKAGQTASMTIVFPSNASLSERTNGLNERTIRRCIGHLVDAGLIHRRDSATRKRFPLRYGGLIRDAFGFDLQPMFERERELTKHAEQLVDDQEKLRSLKAEALALRVEALRQAKDEETVSYLQKVRKLVGVHQLLLVIGQPHLPVLAEPLGAAHVNVPAVAKELGVRYVLEGSVRKAGSHHPSSYFLHRQPHHRA